MRDALEVLQEYGRRNAGNAWAQQLTRMKAFQAVPGEPASGGVSVVRLPAWAPQVGEACLHVGAGRPRLVVVAALDGRFARVLVDCDVFGDGWVESVLVADLNPVVGS